MIALAKKPEHPIDVILVWKFSRFARNQEESIVYKSMLKKDRVEVISISEPVIDGPFGSLIERIIEWMDEYYSIRLSGEVRRGMAQNALRGHYQGNAPIGYLSPGNKQPPRIDPDTCAIPLKAKDLLLYENCNPRQIACYLNEHGYRTKNGNLFDERGIRYLLENPFYCGIARWNKRTRKGEEKTEDEIIYAKGNWEALWDEETYHRLKEKLCAGRQARKMHDTSTVRHWLSGIVICSSCNRTLSSCGTAPKKAFQCWGYTKGLCGISHYIKASLLEEQILAGLEKIQADDHCAENMFRPVSITKKRDYLKKELEKLDKQEKRLKEAFLNEIDTLSEYKEGKKAIQKERSLLIDKINASDTPELVKPNDFISLFRDSSISNIQKADAVRSLLDSVIFDRETSSFYFYLNIEISR